MFGDVTINHDITLKLIQRSHAVVDCAENGLVGCRMFDHEVNKYDLILMYTHMPLMNGFSAALCIRSNRSVYAQQIPIIAMMANASKKDIDRCLACVMNDYMIKPIDFSCLLTKINQVLL